MIPDPQSAAETPAALPHEPDWPLHGRDVPAAPAASTTRRAMLRAAPLALAFLIFRLAFLPSTPDDLDSVNFALGVRDFDVAAHRPHPPGYPIYIALGKLSAAVLSRAAGGTPSYQLEARALGVWSAVFGAFMVFPVFQFFRCVYRPEGIALAATALTIASPLFLFTAGRPMSDVPGLAAGFVAIALLVTAYRRQQRPESAETDTPYAAKSESARIEASGRLVVAGAFAAAIAAGVRTQVIWLTLPLLALVLLHRAGRGAAGALLGSLMTFTLGSFLWFVPLMVASGGPAAYLRVLTTQAREDLSGVDMLITNATPRRLGSGLLDTIVTPWAVLPLAAVVIALAVIGLGLLAWRSRSGLLLLSAVTVPYALFHIALQENVTTRYALPIVPAMALLATLGLSGLLRRFTSFGIAALIAACLIVTVPSSMLYARSGSPLFRALADVQRSTQTETVIAMHHSFMLASRGEPLGRLVLPVEPKREWMAVVRYWLAGGKLPVWFFADPNRTDMAAFDYTSRGLVRAYGWPFEPDRFLKGIRPSALAWYQIRTPPAWFVGEGWSLTPELGGVVDKERGLPGGRPVFAYARSRTDPAVLLIGGRHLGRSGDPDVKLTVSVGDRVLDTWTASPEPGFFLRLVTVPAGALMAGDGYSRLDVRREAADGSKARIDVALEQFDLQPETSPVYGFDTGWHEQEYDPATGLLWRWSSAQAHVRVHHGGRDLTLKLTGESPMRYFDAVPRVIVRAGSQILLRAAPTGDFTLTTRVPAVALDAAGGVLTIETDKVFVPAERSGSADRRSLGLRILSLQLEAGQ